MMQWHARFSVLLVFFSVLQVSKARAEFSVSPGLFVREEYNDNIDLDPKGEEKSDFITTIGPNLTLLWQTRVVDLSLDYGLHFRKYVKHTENDDTNFSHAQRASTEATFSLYRDILFLRISDVYRRVPVDEEGKGGLDNELTNLTDSNTLTVNPYLRFQPWSTVTFQFDYIYRNVWYRDSDAIDSESHTFSGTITKDLTDRLTTSLRGSQTMYRPKKKRDDFGDLDDDSYDRQSLTLSLTFLASDRLTLSGYYGRTWIDYKEEEDSSPEFWGANADFQLSERFSVGGGYSESIGQSVSQGTSKNKGYTAYVNYTNRISATLTGFIRENEYLIEDRTDDVKGLSLSGGLPLSEKSGLDGTILYTVFDQNDNRPGEESDEYDRTSLRIGYYRLLRYGRFSVGYTFNYNNANDEEDDYDQNIVWAQMSFVF